MTQAYDEYYKRLHRIVGYYLAIQAWLRGVDCIVLVHSDLKAFLGLKKIERKHVENFMADVKPWFPSHKRYGLKNAKTSTSSLFLSRIENIAQHLPSGTMTTSDRIDNMKPGQDGSPPPKTKRFSKRNDLSEIPSQVKIVSYLALLADGLKTP